MMYNKNEFAYRNIKGLKPVVCKSCDRDGKCIGDCERCLRNQAFNKELVETSLFIADDIFREYHDRYNGHNEFKGTVLRCKDEHPYLYYGIEIEVEFHSDVLEVFDYDEYDEYNGVSEDIEIVLKKFSEITKGMFVYERDGSLNNGVELISRPTSYKYWTLPETIDLLNKGFEYLKNNGAMIEQPNSNGLHVHISKKFFDFGGKNEKSIDTKYQDMDWLFQFFQKEIEKIGGREYTHYCDSKMNKFKERYNIGENRTDRFYNAEFTVKGKLKKGGQMADGDHYSAITLSGRTIEGRVFNSTIDTNQVLACIEMMRNLSHAVRDGEIVGKTFGELLATKESPHLDKVLANLKRAYKDNTDEFNLDKVCESEMEIK